MVRGEVGRLRIPPDRRGSDQRGPRFAVILQADELLALNTVLVAPTSRSSSSRSFRPVIELGGEATRVLIEQMTAVSPARLGTAQDDWPLTSCAPWTKRWRSYLA